MQFAADLSEAASVSAVNDEYESVSLLVVVAPVGADGLLAAYIPHVETVVWWECECLDIEAECRGDGVDVLTSECFEDGRLAGVVQTTDSNSSSRS